jgi:hypothetical protein
MGVTVFHRAEGGGDDADGIHLINTDDFVSHASSGAYTTRAPLAVTPVKYHAVAHGGVASVTNLDLNADLSQSAANLQM